MAARQEVRLNWHDAAEPRSAGSRYSFAVPTGGIIDLRTRKVQGKNIRGLWDFWSV